MPRRWHFWACFQGPEREKEAQECIEELAQEGRKARIWAPRPEHKTSGHVHVVALISKEELFATIDRWRQELKNGTLK